MSEANIIDAEPREQVGKGAARATRRAGRVPCVIYGAKKDPVSISIAPLELRKNLQAGTFFSTVYEIKIDGGVERVLPREVQLHPVTDVPQHVDFLRVGAATKVTVEVACEFINEEDCVGLTRGGVLNVVRYAIEVLCAVDAIPQTIVVDLAGFDIGDSIHFSHVDVPDGVEPTIADRDFTIATIAAPTVAEEEEEEDEEGIEGVEGDDEDAAEADSEGEGSAEE
ncbi:MAG: 50S ribosomal protein L25 [Alphaproteobacteria bacterium MarineAlpha10_Bin3]|jgi:large subunit ribosomal protein L25|nr:MAG: 50S ribosomal protein L25 [Alphaproteobacteria bacterium MarineAlpha10_Bin3]PPR68047.1 MAG: 50S ribosomal protein L25 [Alphaproteobacteria bacterium MarineAlpha4_Bin1]